MPLPANLNGISDSNSNADQVEADMSEMSSMSESEIHAVMKEQARKKQEDQRKFLEYRSNTRGDLE
jgi:hypothetical protein